MEGHTANRFLKKRQNEPSSVASRAIATNTEQEDRDAGASGTGTDPTMPQHRPSFCVICRTTGHTRLVCPEDPRLRKFPSGSDADTESEGEAVPRNRRGANEGRGDTSATRGPRLSITPLTALQLSAPHGSSEVTESGGGPHGPSGSSGPVGPIVGISNIRELAMNGVNVPCPVCGRYGIFLDANGDAVMAWTDEANVPPWGTIVVCTISHN